MENLYVNKFNEILELFSKRVSEFNTSFNLSEYNDTCRTLNNLKSEYDGICKDANVLESLGFKTAYKYIGEEILVIEDRIRCNYKDLLRDLYNETVMYMETKEDANKAFSLKEKIRILDNEDLNF